MLELVINGEGFVGWLDVSIEQSLNQLADTFQVSVTNPWQGASDTVEFVEGDNVVVKESGEDIITGYIDSVSINYSASDLTITIAGRSKTADLIDCSAIYNEGRGHFHGKNLLEIAKLLAEPFNISVGVDANTDVGGNYKSFAIQQGETVYDALVRAARMRGVLLVSDGAGDLIIAQAGNEVADDSLIYGKNILSGSRTGRFEGRFSQYILKSQSKGSDGQVASSTKPSISKVEDSEVSRYRPTIIISENKETGKALDNRAVWQRTVAKGRSKDVRYRVPGWRQTRSNQLWRPGLLVAVEDPIFKIASDLIIATCRFTLDNSEEEITELSLTLPEAYTTIAGNVPQRRIDDWLK